MKTIFFLISNLEPSGMSSDIIMTYIFLRKNIFFYGKDNGNNYFRC